MIILGIDPGKYGGLAIVRAFGAGAEVADIPIIGEKAKARVNVLELKRWIDDRRPDHCYIERAQAMPRQGSSSGFLYGRCVGAIEAVVLTCGVPMSIIEASAWKKHFRLKGGDKENARALAIQLYPHLATSLARKLDHGRAEALLIARFGLTLLAPMRQAAE